MKVQNVSALAIAAIMTACLTAASPTDPVAELEQKIEQGQAKLTYEPRHGYLESVLDQLHVPKDSQGLVFSKTSFQASKISPGTPRALYFNDDVYVGWVQNGEAVELASVDPVQGPVFYLLSQRRSDHPRFIRQNAACMQCHQSQLTGDVPGLLMRSVYPDHDGMPVFSAGTFLTTEHSPMNQRWGGWYLDGKTSELGMGNGIVENPEQPEQLSQGGADLAKLFDASPYLTSHSDAVPLLVLAHQTHLHNLLTKAATETRVALAEETAIAQAMGQQPPPHHFPTTLTRLKVCCDAVVNCLLFAGESPLSTSIAGSTDFASRFEKLGPFDRRGRSLRQFDLQRRMFKYPCSYLIYSQQFDSLPEQAKQYIYRRMWKVLTGRDDSPQFNHLSDQDRSAIYQILRETKTGLPKYWK